MFNLKNLKIVKQLNSIKPRLKWLMFSQMQDYKINSKYIDMICNDNDTKSDNERLEDIVRESLIREFTPEITKMKSYDFLVDAVVHNLKKKQLANFDKIQVNKE
ncbi:MAG: hypothetical protein KHX03_02980 [Clostridium sp.]|nr:hypothetical protein [Clostridium sp.]